jgi:hypothetical protein
MGMFDYLHCQYPLPVDGANALLYQTKDMECGLDHYEIRPDGTLWFEEYETEDRSDPTAVGLMRFKGSLSKVRRHYEPMPEFTGEIRFYTTLSDDHGGWIEWSAYFVEGAIKELHLIRHEPALATAEGREP